MRRPRGAIIVAVFNQKGGIGKTTTSTNLAVCLAAMGFRSGLIDLDAQGNATSSLGLVPPPARGTVDLLFGSAPAASLFNPTAFPNLWVCGANDALTTADLRLAVDKVPQDVLRRRLAGLTLELDFLLIDCPPAFSMLPLNALVAARRAILPLTVDALAHQGTQKTWNTLRRVRTSVNTGLASPELVLTMLTPGQQDERALARALHEEFGGQVFHSVIPRDPAVRAAAAADLPVCVFDPSAPAARASLRFALEFLLREARRGKGGVAPGDVERLDLAAVLEVLRTWHRQSRPPVGTEAWTDAAPQVAPQVAPKDAPRRGAWGWLKRNRREEGAP